jgi:redox-sensing transcriptional repressor
LNIPEVSIKRLCEISRLLERLSEAGREIIFSDEIGKKSGIPAYQVRKDISYLGEIGTPGRGYNVKDLLNHISSSLHLQEKRKTVLVGVGRLGSALLNYINLAHANCDYVAAFDSNPEKIGTQENDVPIYDISLMLDYVRDNDIEVGVVTVPMDVAQEVVDTLVEGGVTGILNFAPVVIKVPEGVVKRCIDFSLEMKILAAVKSLLPAETEEESEQ